MTHITRIPALEEQITAIICKGHSLAAYKSGSKEMVGIIVLDSKVLHNFIIQL